MGAEDNILELKHISKYYPGVTALDDVSLHVRRGEIHALIGENGAGKSTLIKTCSGAIAPSVGEIIINGKSFLSMTPKLSEENGIGVIYQEFNLMPNLTVGQNIYLGREPRNKYGLIDKKQMYAKAQEMLDFLQVDIDVQEQVSRLGVAQQQLVEVAKALSIDAEILIMDEPTRGIDVGAKYEIYQIMIELAKQGKGIIMISSEMPELIGVSNRILVMCNGHITGEVQGEEATQERIMSYATQF